MEAFTCRHPLYSDASVWKLSLIKAGTLQKSHVHPLSPVRIRPICRRTPCFMRQPTPRGASRWNVWQTRPNRVLDELTFSEIMAISDVCSGSFCQIHSVTEALNCCAICFCFSAVVSLLRWRHLTARTNSEWREECSYTSAGSTVMWKTCHCRMCSLCITMRLSATSRRVMCAHVCVNFSFPSLLASTR